MYVVDLYVEPAWRRAGIGRELIAAAAARSKARGGTHLWWASMPSNAPARRFYDEIGADDVRLHSHALIGKPFEKFAAKGGRSAPRKSVR
jgi:ribosomal protein S18 acetylase RimI-like enzyme